MDAFEQLVSEMLWLEGCWVQQSVKVSLTKSEKLTLRKPSLPRFELDIVAYSGRDNLLRIVECKSYLDSRGVIAKELSDGNLKSRYKLFNDAQLRKIVLNRLRQQLVDTGACSSNVNVKLCLACGRIASERSRSELKALFKKNNWELWDETWLRAKLKKMSDGSYENSVSAVVSKLLLRKPFDEPPEEI